MKEHYEALRKKQKLPSYEDISFFLFDLDKEKLSLRALLFSMRETYNDYAKSLEKLLQPDANLTSMTEANAFTIDERKKIFELLKSMMKTLREIDGTLMTGKDEERTITEAVMSWPAIREELTGLITRMKEAWERETDKTIKEMYFG